MAIPKKAVKALIEHCNKFGGRTGRSGAEVFSDYLRWMKKYADFFFSSDWPAKHVLDVKSWPWMSDEEFEFINGSASYEEEIERFTVVLLRRNLDLEGFQAGYFESEFEYYGLWFCGDCSVPDAMYLREYFQKLKEAEEWLENRLKEEQSDFLLKIQEARSAPWSVKHNKMEAVKLEFLEVDGEAEGKVCTVHNKYLCPYGAKALELVELGRDFRSVWKLVEFYDHHWNGSPNFTPAACEAKWYHFHEPAILDVTSSDDILRALKDGRINRIAKEFVEFKKSKAS